MDLTGKIVGISTNFLTKKFELSVAVNEAATLTAGYDDLKDVDLLDIRIRKHRKGRSLNANAYFHVLVDKLADKVSISKPRCKNIMIGRYGQPMYVDESETSEAVIKTNIPVSQMLENESIHCMPCGSRTEKNGEEVVYYKIFRGSHTYSTAEMATLINGTVDECKDMGIETLPPDELERMISAWHAGA